MSRVAVSRRKYLKDPLPLPPLLTPCFLDFPASYRRNSRCAREWQNRVRFLRAGTASRRVLGSVTTGQRGKIDFSSATRQRIRSIREKEKKEKRNAYTSSSRSSVYQDHIVGSILPLSPTREER